MIANYDVVKDTLFGRLLGCALPQVIKDRLSRNESTEFDLTALDISIKVNGLDVDLHKLFSVVERSLQEQPIRGAAGAAVSEDVLERQLCELRQVLENLGDKQNSAAESCTDAIAAASSSYYCGEYASESANEAGHEHHCGDEFLYEEINALSSIIDNLQEAQGSWVREAV